LRIQNESPLSDNINGSDWNSLVGNMESLLTEIKPTLIASPYPKIDGSGDHKFSTIALIEAIKNLQIKEGSLLLYTNHLPNSEIYPFGQNGGTISLPPNFDTTLFFNSLYSFPLSVEKQGDKVLVLDAMNDIRLDTEWRSIKGAFVLLLKNIRNAIFNSDYSYYRRAVRSNELYFVVDIEELYDDTVLDLIYGDLTPN